MTGGIGSGKTTVCGIFRELGVPVYSADERARKLMVEDERLMSGIRDEFGDAAYDNGTLNRPFLAATVFSDPDRLNALNALVHPAVASDLEVWMAEHHKNPYVVKEAAILFESGAHRATDSTVLVTAPEQLRIDRVIARDAVSEDEVRRRMANQWPDDRKTRLADHVIVNDGAQLLIPRVLELHRQFEN